MNRGQARKKIAYNLDDFGVFYSVEDINESIQDGYDEIAVVSESIERQVDLSVDVILNTMGGGKPWLHIKTLIPDYYRPLAILNMSTRQFLTPNIDRNEDDYKIGWQISNTANVYSFIINGPEWIALPNGYWQSSNQPLRVFYIAVPLRMQTDDDPFRILNEYQFLIELYSTADLLEQNREFTKAQQYWTDYEVGLNEYRLKILSLSKADRKFYREIC